MSPSSTIGDLGHDGGYQAGRDRLGESTGLAPDELGDGERRRQDEEGKQGDRRNDDEQGVRQPLLAPTMSVSTPVVVALAATAATASTKIQMQDVTERTASIGLRIRRSS